jgi:hypothetical protein
MQCRNNMRSQIVIVCTGIVNFIVGSKHFSNFKTHI